MRYTITKTPAGAATIMVGAGPVDDLLEVVRALRQDGITMVKVTPATSERRQDAEAVDRLLYEVGFDVADVANDGAP